MIVLNVMLGPLLILAIMEIVIFFPGKEDQPCFPSVSTIAFWNCFLGHNSADRLVCHLFVQIQLSQSLSLP